MPMWTLYKIIDRTAYLLPVHPWQTAELSNKIQEVVEYTLDADLLYSACDARKELTGTMQLMSMLSDGSVSWLHAKCSSGRSDIGNAMTRNGVKVVGLCLKRLAKLCAKLTRNQWFRGWWVNVRDWELHQHVKSKLNLFASTSPVHLPVNYDPTYIWHFEVWCLCRYIWFQNVIRVKSLLLQNHYRLPSPPRCSGVTQKSFAARL